MSNNSLLRITEDVKREITAALRDIKDPRVTSSFVTVTHCHLNSDLSLCKVHISCLGSDDKKTAEVITGLNSASGFFKKKIAARVKLRKIPELMFVSDSSLAYYEKINQLLKGEIADEQSDS
jgi:ribosome-binding factor A